MPALVLPLMGAGPVAAVLWWTPCPKGRAAGADAAILDLEDAKVRSAQDMKLADQLLGWCEQEQPSPTCSTWRWTCIQFVFCRVPAPWASSGSASVNDISGGGTRNIRVR